MGISSISSRAHPILRKSPRKEFNNIVRLKIFLSYLAAVLVALVAKFFVSASFFAMIFQYYYDNCFTGRDILSILFFIYIPSLIVLYLANSIRKHEQKDYDKLISDLKREIGEDDN